MNKLSIIILSFLGAGLMACSSIYIANQTGTLIPIEKGEEQTSNMEESITPYRDTLDQEMNLIIAQADTNFIVERPSGNLNNWVASAILTHQTKHVRLSIPVVCLLNTGGLRSSINKGPVTLADIFKIMPFDNTVVWVKMPIESLSDIQEYLLKSGGEPIANASLKDGQLLINGVSKETKEFLVITSDYLANGGDKMNFFKKAIEKNDTGILMRDCLIEEAKNQGTLVSEPTPRIELK